MVVRNVRHHGTAKNHTGSFPSYLMPGVWVRYESLIELDMLRILEIERNVVRYLTQPFTTDDKYTPDMQVFRRGRRNLIIECKPEDKLENAHTRQQIDRGERWADDNDHDFMVVTDADLRGGGGHYLANATLLWRYRHRRLPAPFIDDCMRAVAHLGDAASIEALAVYLAQAAPSFHPTPVIYNLIFHHMLATDLTRPLGSESPLWAERLDAREG
jgi:hypothetical protein